MAQRGLERLWRPTRRAAAAFPLTARGALAAGLAALSLWYYGYGTLDLVVFALGSAGLALTLLCVLTVGAAALRVSRAGEGRGESLGRIEAGAPVATAFSMPSLSRWPLLQLEWSWIAPAGVTCEIQTGRARSEEIVRAGARGEATEILRRFSLGDAFGLARVRWERREARSFWVLPRVGALRRVSLLHSLAGAEGVSHPAGEPEGDRMEIRRYAFGDSPRHILWKTYARTGKLNVRTPERSLDRAKRTIAYLVAGPDDEAAAAAARVTLEAGMLGAEWIFGADGTEEPVDELEAALRAIARSGAPSLRQRGGARLAAFLLAASGATPDATSCVVFAPGRPGPWTESALAVARQREGQVSFVLGVDGLAPPTPTPPLWRRALFTSDPSADASVVSTDAHALLLRRLAETGAQAVVVDRVSGRSFAPGRQQALRMSA